MPHKPMFSIHVTSMFPSLQIQIQIEIEIQIQKRPMLPARSLRCLTNQCYQYKLMLPACSPQCKYKYKYETNINTNTKQIWIQIQKRPMLPSCSPHKPGRDPSTGLDINFLQWIEFLTKVKRKETWILSESSSRNATQFKLLWVALPKFGQNQGSPSDASSRLVRVSALCN